MALAIELNIIRVIRADRAGLAYARLRQSKEHGHSLDDESIQMRELVGDGGFGRRLEVLLLILAGNGVLVAEDEVYLYSKRACERRVSYIR